MNYYANGPIRIPLRPAKYTGTRRAQARLTTLIAEGAALGAAIGAAYITNWYTNVIDWYTTIFQSII